jgi:hypothetical protein
MQNEVVGEAGGEDERRAFKREHHLGLEEAGYLVGVVGLKRGKNSLLDGGEANDDDGVRLVKGGRGVETEVKGGTLGESEAGDVLELRGAEHADDVDGINDGTDICGVKTTTSRGGIRGGVDKVRGGAAGESFGDAGAVAIIEEDGSAGLGEADDLLVDRLLEAVGIRLEGEGGGEFGGTFGDGLRVILRDRLHGSEVALDALLLEGGLVEVGVSADEKAGTAFDGRAKRFEVSAYLRHDEHHGLFGALWNDDVGALDGFLIPGVDLGEPVVWGKVSGAAQEGDDEEEMVGLGVGEIGLDPELVAWLEAWDFGDGEAHASARDADVDLWADEVKACSVCSVEGWGEKRREETHCCYCDRLNFHLGGLDARWGGGVVEVRKMASMG